MINISDSFNPIKDGGSESMYNWGGASQAPLEKALENIYWVKMHGYNAIFQGQVIEKKD